MSRRDARGFTIVELMAVIAIMTLLIGLLLPAVAGVRKSGHKSRELNHLRQVAVAWTVYANNNNGYVLPGEVGPNLHGEGPWQVRYTYPNGQMIAPQIAAHWPWRLAPLMDDALETLHGYAEAAGHDHFLVRNGTDANEVDTDDDGLPDAAQFATRPAFGYNGYYIGGLWRKCNRANHIGDVPRWVFYDATRDFNGNGRFDPGEHTRVTAHSIGQIRRPDQLVLFAGAFRPGDSGTQPTMSGIEYERLGRRSETIHGTHLVTPGLLLDARLYELPLVNGARGTEITIEVVDEPPAHLELPWGVPLGRYTGAVATAHPDGSVETLLPGAFVDQRRFIDVADAADFAHDRDLPW